MSIDELENRLIKVERLWGEARRARESIQALRKDYEELALKVNRQQRSLDSHTDPRNHSESIEEVMLGQDAGRREYSIGWWLWCSEPMQALLKRRAKLVWLLGRVAKWVGDGRGEM